MFLLKFLICFCRELLRSGPSRRHEGIYVIMPPRDNCCITLPQPVTFLFSLSSLCILFSRLFIHIFLFFESRLTRNDDYEAMSYSLSSVFLLSLPHFSSRLLVLIFLFLPPSLFLFTKSRTINTVLAM